MIQIARVEIHEFAFDAANLGSLTGADTIGSISYSMGAVTRMPKMRL